MPGRRPRPGPLLDVVEVRAARCGLVDVSFRVTAGSRHALVVPAAPGTGLLEVIAGISYPDHGQVYVDGHPVTGRPLSKLTRDTIGYLPALPRVYPAASVRGVLEWAVRWRVLTRRRTRAGLTGRQQIADMMHRCGLGPFADVRPDRLPPGWPRMLDLAVVLLHQPRLILVDQATTGLADCLHLFRRTLTGLPHTVAVLTTVPTINDTVGLADHVTVIDGGQVIASEPVTWQDDT